MATMGKYCKAYYLKELRKFKEWTESSENARKEKEEVDDNLVLKPRELTDENLLYLQENYVVTDSIFKDKNIIFEDVTPEWVIYCQKILGFEPPSEQEQINVMLE
jgi:hypothetical protein